MSDEVDYPYDHFRGNGGKWRAGDIQLVEMYMVLANTVKTETNMSIVGSLVGQLLIERPDIFEATIKFIGENNDGKTQENVCS